MKKRMLYIAWAVLYAICTALGFAGEVQGAGRVFMVLAAAIFFLPPAALVVLGIRDRDRKSLRTVRIISIVSLALTLIFFIANVAVAVVAQTTNGFLHVCLVLVSTPMLCGQYWALSLFLWASLLFASFLKPKKGEA